jgi:hypothetical protein
MSQDDPTPMTDERASEPPTPEPPSDPPSRAPSEPSEPSEPSDESQAPGRPRRVRRRWIFSNFVLLLVTVITLVARTEWAARTAVANIARQVRAATGLDLRIGRAGWSWRRFALHAEGIELRHPREGLLARVEWIDVRPSLRGLTEGQFRIGGVELDGGEVRLVFRRDRLVNGPTLPPGPPPPPGPPTLPFRDVALSDLRVHIEHDRLGAITLDSVDLDLRNEQNRRLLIGVLSRGGRLSSMLRSPVTGERCFDGAIQRIEARAELSSWRTLRVGAAHVRALDAELHVSDATIPLNLNDPVSPLNTREDIRANLRASVPLSVATCPLPREAPMLRGVAHVTASATLNVPTMTGTVRGSARTRGLTVTLLDPRPLGRNGTFGAGRSVEIDFHGDQRAITIDRFEAEYAGGRVFSPSPRRRDKPLVFTLAPTPRLDGFFETQGLRFEELMRELSITDFARVFWTIDTLAEIALVPERLGRPPDLDHPALHIGFDADTRDFAIMKDFHRWGPPHEPLIAIGRSRVALDLDFDGTSVRFSKMSAEFGRSRLHGDEIRIHTVHDTTRPDLIVRNLHGPTLDLADVGRVAGIPIAGTGSATVNASGHFSDIVVRGSTEVNGYQFAGLPIGDVRTAPGHPWELRGITLRAPRMLIDKGASHFVVHDALLDFSRYTLVAAARVESSDAQLMDYYRMFEFENDPVFTPYTGGTMRDCSPEERARGPRSSECWVSDTPHPRPRRGEARPANARPRHGFVRADVEFILGRPGDDPKGVLHADVRAWDVAVHAFDETVQHADLHATYDWLIKDRGFRGARLDIEYARGHLGRGTVEAGGTVDLGGRMHVNGTLHGADLGELELTRGMNLRGYVDGTGALEGTSDAQRWSMDIDLRQLSAAQRAFGDVRLRVRSSPDPQGRALQDAVNTRLASESNGHASAPPASLPPPQRWSLVADALGGAVRVDGSMLVPFVQEPWRDPDGVWQRDARRSWRDAVLRGSIALSRPGAGDDGALDLLPWLPARWIARLGDAPSARAALRLDLDELSLQTPALAQGRVSLDALDLRALGARVALPPGRPLALCVHSGHLWIDPAAARRITTADERANDPCRQPPQSVFGPLNASRAMTRPVASLLGPAGITVDLSGGATAEGSLALNVAGSVDLARLAPLAPSVVEQALGIARFSVDVVGTSSDPELRGRFELDSGSLRASALPQPVDDLDLTLRLDGTLVTLERASARFGSSSVDLSGGTIRAHGRDLERLEIPVRVRNLSLTPNSGIDVALDVDGQLSWSERDPLPVFAGDVTLNRARYTRNIDMALLQDSANGGGAPAPEEPYDPSRDKLRLDLTVHAREPLRVRNNLIDADVDLSPQSALRVVGTDQRPSVLGPLNVTRGRIFFRGNEFEVRRSRIEFDNPERISPTFDLLATTEIRRSSESAGNRNQWRIDLHASGTRDRFSLDMRADPSLSREDIALMLAFRMTRAELDQLGAGEFGQILAVEALSNLAGLDRIVRRNVPLITDFNITSGYSPTQGRSVPQVSVRVPLAAGVRAGAIVNITEQREVRGTIDAEINRQHAVQVGIDNYGQGGSQGRGGVVNAGVDWRFRLELE